MSQNEFELIELILSRLEAVTEGSDVVIGPGDDAAVVSLEPGTELVVSTDVMLEGTHFPPGSRGDLVGYRAIAVAVSDIVAMGAQPTHVTVALTLDSVDTAWLSAFADGIAFIAKERHLRVIGGNLAKGPTSVAVTAVGSVPSGQALRRRGARPADDIWVTGRLGATIAFLDRGAPLPAHDLEILVKQRQCNPVAAYFLPPDRSGIGTALRGIATSMIDLSDGLVSELAHLTNSTCCGAEIRLEVVPTWTDLQATQLLGPDDSYELLFTASAEHRTKLISQHGSVLTRIGRINDTGSVAVRHFGKLCSDFAGFSHF